MNFVQFILTFSVSFNFHRINEVKLIDLKKEIHNRIKYLLEIVFCVSPSSGDAYCDLKLTLNFEFCLPICFSAFLFVDMFPYEDSKTVSVCLSVPREKKSP